MAVRRGVSRCWDHCQLVHEQWSFLVTNGISVHVERVSTHDNIADAPSRESGTPRVLYALGAWYTHPVMPEHVSDHETWTELQERWRLTGQ